MINIYSGHTRYKWYSRRLENCCFSICCSTELGGTNFKTANATIIRYDSSRKFSISGMNNTSKFSISGNNLTSYLCIGGNQLTRLCHPEGSRANIILAGRACPDTYTVIRDTCSSHSSHYLITLRPAVQWSINIGRTCECCYRIHGNGVFYTVLSPDERNSITLLYACKGTLDSNGGCVSGHSCHFDDFGIAVVSCWVYRTSCTCNAPCASSIWNRTLSAINVCLDDGKGITDNSIGRFQNSIIVLIYYQGESWCR